MTACQTPSAAAGLLAAVLRGERPPWPFTSREDEAVVLAAAVEHNVHALVAHALEGAHLDWPASIREALRQRAIGEIATEALRDRELRIVLDGFAEAGLSPLLFKGAALARTHYAQPHLRPRFDTDIMLARVQIDPAVRVLERFAYRRSPLVSGELVMSQVDYEKTDERGARHVFDLHWKPVNPQALANVLRWTDLDAAAVPLPFVKARAPAPIHSALLACLHRVGHHAGDERLIWLFDIDLLFRRMSVVELEAFVDEARRRRVTAVAASGVEAAARWFGTPLPPGFRERLTGGRKATSNEPSATYAAGGMRRIDVLVSDFKTMPRWRDRLALICQHAFPPAGYMMVAYGTTRRGVLPALYAHRLLTGTWKWLRRAV